MRVVGNFTRVYHLTLPLSCPAIGEEDYLELFHRVRLPIPPGGPSEWCQLLNTTLPWATLDLLPGPECANGDYIEEEIAYRFSSDGQLFCFDQSSVDVLRSSSLNPYTGRALPASVVRDLHITTPLPPVELQCTQCPIAPTPCQVKARLSPAAEQWLLQWMKTGHYPGQRLEKIPLSLRTEFAKYRRCETLHLYRGLRFKTNTAGEKVRGELQHGHSSPSLSSWSYTQKVAEAYAYQAEDPAVGLLLEVVVSPSDIFLDTTLLPYSFYKEHSITRQGEVILLPGTYPVTVLKEWWLPVSASASAATPPVRVKI